MSRPKPTTDEVLAQLRAHQNNAIILCYGPKLRVGTLCKRAIAEIEKLRAAAPSAPAFNAETMFHDPGKVPRS